MKVKDDVHILLGDLSRAISKEERRAVAMGDVVERAIKSDEIKLRLLVGAKERRMGLK